MKIMTLEEMKKMLAIAMVHSAFVKEHKGNNDDFFISEGTIYCRKCNLPLEKMEMVLAYRCLGCDICIPKEEVLL